MGETVPSIGDRWCKVFGPRLEYYDSVEKQKSCNYILNLVIYLIT